MLFFCDVRSSYRLLGDLIPETAVDTAGGGEEDINNVGDDRRRFIF